MQVLCACCTLWLAADALAQSGRRIGDQKNSDRQPSAARTGGTSRPTRSEVKADHPSASPADDEEVVRIVSRLVPIPASVTDEAGRPLVGLRLEDFELRVDGETKPIADLARAESPVRMAILFDNSASITVAREFQKRAAIAFFRRVVRPIDRAALFSVSTTAELVQPLTNDVERLVRAIENFGKPTGATALLDGIAQAAAYLRPHEGRHVIVIISDGADTISEVSFESVLNQVVVADCQVYAVQTGQSDNPNLRDLVAERRLQELAAQTGGAVYVPRDQNELEAAFAQIAADLSQQYLLSYYATDDPLDGRFRRITLTVRSHPAARVRTRRGYYAPKS